MTKEELEALLKDTNAKIEAQGRIIDSRLLSKRDQIQRVLETYNKEV